MIFGPTLPPWGSRDLQVHTSSSLDKAGYPYSVYLYILVFKSLYVLVTEWRTVKIDVELWHIMYYLKRAESQKLSLSEWIEGSVKIQLLDRLSRRGMG